MTQIANEAGQENIQDKPTEQWRRLVVASLTNKSAYLVTPSGENPGLEYGWIKSVRKVWHDGIQDEEETVRGGGSQIGWIDGDDIYLLPVAAYKAAKAIGSATGDDITTLEPTLRKFLLQDGVLASTDLSKARKAITTRRFLEKVQHDVLHVKKQYFYPETPPINLPDLSDLSDFQVPESASHGSLGASHVSDLNGHKSSHVSDYGLDKKSNIEHDARNIPQTSHIPQCSTKFESLMSTPHEKRGGSLQDKAGNPWCEGCILQHDLMNIGHERNYAYVEVEDPHDKRHTLKLKAGHDAWLHFCKTMGYASIRRVLQIVEVKV